MRTKLKGPVDSIEVGWCVPDGHPLMPSLSGTHLALKKWPICSSCDHELTMAKASLLFEQEKKGQDGRLFMNRFFGRKVYCIIKIKFDAT